MADNIAVEPSAAAGAVDVATEDISSVHYPVNKLAHGAAGSASIVAKANPLPVASSAYSHALSGNAFFGWDVRNSIADSTTVDWVIITGANPAYLYLEVSAVGAFACAIGEDSTAVGNGSARSSLNYERSSATTLLTVVYQNPTSTIRGTTIGYAFGMDGYNSIEVTQTYGEGGLLLKASTKHLIEFTNLSGVSQDCQLRWRIIE